MTKKLNEQERAQVIYKALLEIIVKSPKGTHWEEIVSLIPTKTGLEIKNWLEVRRVVQQMHNEQLIIRTPQYDIEHYTKL